MLAYVVAALYITIITLFAAGAVGLNYLRHEAERREATEPAAVHPEWVKAMQAQVVR